MTDREKLISLMEDKVREITCWGGEMLYLLNPEKLADHLLANGVTVNDWRDAKTDPPNSDEDVLLCFSNGTMAVGGLREDGGWYSNTDAEWYTDCENVPEKWHPLP